MDALCPGQPTPAAAGGSILSLDLSQSHSHSHSQSNSYSHGPQSEPRAQPVPQSVAGGWSLVVCLCGLSVVVGHSLIGVGVVGQLAMI